MKKNSFALLMLLLSNLTFSQDLLFHVPKNADYVLTINGSSLNHKMPFTELEKLPFYKKGFKSLLKLHDSVKALNCEELGLYLKSNSYSYYQTTDSMYYWGYITQIADANKFKTFISSISKEIDTTSSGIQFMNNKYNAIAWNDLYVLFINGKPRKPAIDFGNINMTTTENEMPSYEMEDEKLRIADSIAAADALAAEEAVYAEEEEMDENDKKAQELLNLLAAAENGSDKYASDWRLAHIEDIFFMPPSKSIATNKKFVKQRNKNADISFWSDTYFETIMKKQMSMPMMLGMAPPAQKQESLFDNKSLSSQLFFNETSITVTSETTTNRKLAKINRKISKAKFNKKFLKYLPTDNLVGYYSMVLNMEELLVQFPNIVKDVFHMTPFLSNYADIMDLYSLIIDEKAIGKFIKGDVMFAVTDLVEKEKKFKSFSFEKDNFEKEKVDKSKTELMPEMLLMVSTDNSEMFQKLLNTMSAAFLIMKTEEGYYKNAFGKGATPFYLLLKDGIFFYCNTERLAKSIAAGEPFNQLNKKIQKDIKKSCGSLYFNSELCFSKLSTSFSSGANKVRSESVYKKFSKIYLHSTKPKGKKSKATFTVELNDVKKNSLQQIVAFIDEMYTINEHFKEEDKKRDAVLREAEEAAEEAAAEAEEEEWEEYDDEGVPAEAPDMPNEDDESNELGE